MRLVDNYSTLCSGSEVLIYIAMPAEIEGFRRSQEICDTACEWRSIQSGSAAPEQAVATAELVCKDKRTRGFWGIGGLEFGGSRIYRSFPMRWCSVGPETTRPGVQQRIETEDSEYYPDGLATNMNKDSSLVPLLSYAFNLTAVLSMEASFQRYYSLFRLRNIRYPSFLFKNMHQLGLKAPTHQLRIRCHWGSWCDFNLEDHGATEIRGSIYACCRNPAR